MATPEHKLPIPLAVQCQGPDDPVFIISGTNADNTRFICRMSDDFTTARNLNHAHAIVRACNAHDSLVEALAKLLVQAEDDWRIGDSFDGRGKLVRQARAALSKAKPKGE